MYCDFLLNPLLPCKIGEKRAIDVIQKRKMLSSTKIIRELVSVQKDPYRMRTKVNSRSKFEI